LSFSTGCTRIIEIGACSPEKCIYAEWRWRLRRLLNKRSRCIAIVLFLDRRRRLRGCRCRSGPPSKKADR
jgi:hypothetical protein